MKLEDQQTWSARCSGRKAQAPGFDQAGHPDKSITVFLVTGRGRAGRAGTGVGFDMYSVRTHSALWFTNGVQIRSLGDTSTSWQRPRVTDNGYPRRRA